MQVIITTKEDKFNNVAHEKKLTHFCVKVRARVPTMKENPFQTLTQLSRQERNTRRFESSFWNTFMDGLPFPKTCRHCFFAKEFYSVITHLQRGSEMASKLQQFSRKKRVQDSYLDRRQNCVNKQFNGKTMQILQELEGMGMYSECRKIKPISETLRKEAKLVRHKNRDHVMAKTK